MFEASVPEFKKGNKSDVIKIFLYYLKKPYEESVLEVMHSDYKYREKINRQLFLWGTIAQCDRALDNLWSNISELNYWARIISFQKLNVDYHLEEIM